MSARNGIVQLLAGIWPPLTRALGNSQQCSPASHSTNSRMHRACGHQPDEGISTAVVTHASLYGNTLSLAVTFPYVASKPWGVFEVPVTGLWDLCSNRRIKFHTPAELTGARIQVHTGQPFQHDGQPRSRVSKVMILSMIPPDSTH